MAGTDKVPWCQEGKEMLVLMLTEMTKWVGKKFLPTFIRPDICFGGGPDL